MMQGPDTALGYGVFDELIGEYMELLPHSDLFPEMSPEEVKRFVALGARGDRLFREDDAEGAIAAYRGQIDLHPWNFEPFLRLSLVHASRGDSKAALAELRSAVLRGYTDLRRLEKAEAWSGMRRSREFLFLQDAIPVLQSYERKWPGWNTFNVWVSPKSFEAEMQRYEWRRFRLGEMAPAFGPRQTRLWERMLERESAASLQAYVLRKHEAEDLPQAIDRLMTLYSNGPLTRWELVPEGPAEGLEKVSALLLSKYPESAMAPVAHVAGALVRYRERDKKGRLTSDAAAAIRASLDAVLEKHPESSVAPVAMVGLIRTAMKTGDRAGAREIFETHRDAMMRDEARASIVRENLGTTALILGGLPGFEATTLTGTKVSPAAFEGRIAVIDFWATWCTPCLDEFPTMNKIALKHGKSVDIVGFNLDEADEMTPDALKAWIAERGVPGRHVQDGLGWESELVERFGVKEIPFTVVVDADGTVLAVNHHGKKLERTVRDAVKRATERARARIEAGAVVASSAATGVDD